MKKLLAAALLASGLYSVPAAAVPVSIGFEGPANGAAPMDLSEDGFTVIATDMFISSAVGSGDGTDGTNEIERSSGTSGFLSITRPGSPFQFVSLDWQAESGTPMVEVLGYFGGALLGTDTFSTSSSSFTTFFASVLAGLTLDELIINPQRDGSGLGSLDAVVLDDARGGVIPVPASLVLLGTAMLGFGGLRRRKKTDA